MKTIKVSNKHALIDDEDFPLISAHTWWLTKGGYAYTQVGGRKNNTTILMHRLILSCKSGQEVNHKDFNPLNNQRSNLQLCTRSQNNMYKRPVARFKGARWTKNAWQSEIKKDRRYYYLGRFKTELEAALAYNEAAKRLFGEFAYLNVTGREIIVLQTNKIRERDSTGN